jgi:phage gpG-like protein
MRVVIEDDGTLSFVAMKMRRLGDANLRQMLADIGSEVESQTRYRIQTEKKAPDGSEWEDWSESYAGSKHGSSAHQPHPGSLRQSGGHSLLQLTGGLLDSLQYEVRGNDVLVGSNLAYAEAVNSQREYLGLSRENIDDIENLVVDFFERRLV